jgi:mono/diheme cytochrome c family protein
MTDKPTRTASSLWGVGLILVLFMAGAAVTYLGIQDRPLPTSVEPGAASESLPLPHDEPEIPQGPHRDQFATNCVVCHSPRLIFNQPPLTAAQWTATVHKMVTAYGAVVAEPREKEIVAYLVALQQRDKDTP